MSSSKIDDGGPAFPRQSLDRDLNNGSAGMSLRDYFAGQALVGSSKILDGEYKDLNMEKYAKFCYSMADAMLKQRQK